MEFKVGDKINHVTVPVGAMPALEVLEVSPCDGDIKAAPHPMYRVIGWDGKSNWVCGNDVRPAAASE